MLKGRAGLTSRWRDLVLVAPDRYSRVGWAEATITQTYLRRPRAVQVDLCSGSAKRFKDVPVRDMAVREAS